MKIVILGAGRVGASVAENLVCEHNDITVIDTNPEELKILQERYDLRTVIGNGIHPTTLSKAGAEDVDLLIACARQDETNLVACKVAKQIFNVPTCIARIRDAEFVEHNQLTGAQGFGVDYMICPEQSITSLISQLIHFPETLQVLEFAKGKVNLVAVRALAGSPLVGHLIEDFKKHLPQIAVRIVAIYRDNQLITPTGKTIIEAGDEVFCLAASQHIRKVIAEFRQIDRPVRRIIIAGGGNIGLRLARKLDGHYNVKIIDRTKKRCEYLAGQLSSSSLVFQGDATNEDLLEDEAVQDTDLFIAVTNDDEDNIMAALLAKRMGARRVIALINRKAYGDLVQGGQIDIALAPAQATIGELLAYVRRGDIVAVHSLRRGTAEAIEAIAHGDAKSSRIVGKKIGDIDLFNGNTPGAIIGGIVRGSGESAQVLMGHHDVVIQSEDHLIVLVSKKRLIPKVEKLFQVDVGFL